MNKQAYCAHLDTTFQPRQDAGNTVHGNHNFNNYTEVKTPGIRKIQIWTHSCESCDWSLTAGKGNSVAPQISLNPVEIYYP